MAYEARCEQCGQVFRDESKEQTARDLEAHAQQNHGMSISREQAEEKVRQRV